MKVTAIELVYVHPIYRDSLMRQFAERVTLAGDTVSYGDCPPLPLVAWDGTGDPAVRELVREYI
jgi:hypothetical protein